MAVPYTLPVLLSTVKAAYGASSTLSNLRPGVGAPTNTVAAGGWLSGTPTLLAYRGAANLNVSAANCAQMSAFDEAFGGGSAAAGVTLEIRANGQLYIESTYGFNNGNLYAEFGDNPNRWLYRTGYNSDADVTEHVEVRFTKRSGVSTSWGITNNTWFPCSTTRTVQVFASRSGGGSDSDSIRGWLAFRKAGDTSNTLLGNTFIDLDCTAISYTGVEP